MFFQGFTLSKREVVIRFVILRSFLFLLFENIQIFLLIVEVTEVLFQNLLTECLVVISNSNFMRDSVKEFVVGFELSITLHNLFCYVVTHHLKVVSEDCMFFFTLPEDHPFTEFHSFKFLSLSILIHLSNTYVCCWFALWIRVWSVSFHCSSCLCEACQCRCHNRVVSGSFRHWIIHSVVTILSLSPLKSIHWIHGSRTGMKCAQFLGLLPLKNVSFDNEVAYLKIETNVSSSLGKLSKFTNNFLHNQFTRIRISHAWARHRSPTYWESRSVLKPISHLWSIVLTVTTYPISRVIVNLNLIPSWCNEILTHQETRRFYQIEWINWFLVISFV